MPKRIVPLSDLAVKNAKPAAKDYTLYDGDGLMLLVKTTGGKLWRFKYRFNGHEKRMAMGAYPEVSLKDARLKREVSRKQVANGIDPAVEIKQQKEVAASKAETFAVVAREWLERQSERISETHSKRIWRSFEKDVLPKIGVTPINEITIPILVDVIRAIEDRGAGETASKVLQWIAAIFRYCLHTGKLVVNPASDMRGILKSRSVTHRAMLAPHEIPEFFNRLNNYNGEPLTRLALELLILTLCRTGEIRGAKWEEFDLAQREWKIPGERMKMKTPHIVALSNQALVVLAQIKQFSGGQGLLFPGRTNRDKPFWLLDESCGFEQILYRRSK